MKILVASHTYIVKLNCEKLKKLANLRPDIEVTVVVPKIWQPGGVQNKVIESQPWEEGNFKVVPLSNFSQNNQGLLTFGQDIIALLKDFQPNIIQVEQGIKSFAYAEFITLNKFLNLKAKNCFFTWWNLPYQSKFPLSLLENYNIQNTDGLVAGNKDAVDILQDHGFKNQHTILPQLGVDEQLFAPKEQPKLSQEFGMSDAEFVIGFVGRFVREKGILTLIKALSKLKDLNWKLLLLGRGELKETLKEEAEKIGINERLILVESVPHDEVANYINLMNVLVLPSETDMNFKTLTSVGWKEQFGHVLIEAMACKVPVIGSNSGEIPNVIGEAGMIFPEKDADALSHCLRQLIEQPQQVEQYANLGYQRAMENYTNLAIAQKQLAFYEELIQQN
ncbi:MAG: hormogonium polysaccharide biosynthesis glycosyltransferase HpsO [Microcystaceae cyanobacterium]